MRVSLRVLNFGLAIQQGVSIHYRRRPAVLEAFPQVLVLLFVIIIEVSIVIAMLRCVGVSVHCARLDERAGPLPGAVIAQIQ